jgi:hypothetical protein
MFCLQAYACRRVRASLRRPQVLSGLHENLPGLRFMDVGLTKTAQARATSAPAAGSRFHMYCSRTLWRIAHRSGSIRIGY